MRRAEKGELPARSDGRPHVEAALPKSLLELQCPFLILYF